MRIEVLERTPGETAYHAVNAPGLRVWSSSAPGVKTYSTSTGHQPRRTGLLPGGGALPLVQRKGKLLKTQPLRTRRCEQPAPASTETETPPASAGNPATTG